MKNVIVKGNTDFQTYDVLGVPVAVTSLEKSFKSILNWSNDGFGRFVCVRDVHGIMQAQKNETFMRLHHEAAMVTPDGMPLVWTGQSRGLPVERTTGPDLMMYVLRNSPNTALKHYFYGGKEGVAAELRDSFQRFAPNAAVVGVGTPPFRSQTPDELDKVAETIIASGANVVWIGISTPNQEFLMSELSKRAAATFIGVGAAFDFHAGRVKRAPLWMQRHGLEWLHRLSSEPARLWRRYLIMAPKFAMLMLLRRLKSAV